MGRVGEAVEEPDRERLDRFLPQHRDERRNGALVERQQDPPAHVHPFRHGQAEVARHERLWQADAKVVLVVAALVAHRQHVAEPGGRDQRGRGSLTLDDRVGRQGRTVHEDGDIRRRDPGGGKDGLYPGDDPLFRGRRSRQHLCRRPASGVFQGEVGEGAADIDGQARAGHAPSIPRGRRMNTFHPGVRER